jgi:DNA-binding HxlR family transcriptional regulator
MTSVKTYGQFCGLARSLDRVGDRWTLLVVRELLLGPRTFRELTQALVGISPNLLSHRLRALADDGLVQRNDAPARSKTVVFRLTDAGEALEPVVRELIRWGARWMMSGPGGDLVDARWTLLALRALLDGTQTRQRRDGSVHIDAGGVPLTIRIHAGKRSVRSGFEGAARASVSAPMTSLLSAACGLGGLYDANVQMDGDIALIGEALVDRR